MLNPLHPIPGAFADLNDAALLDKVYGVTVVFLNPAVPFYYPAEQMEGVIQDIKTNKRGERFLLIKADKLNFPKWINVQAVQFPAQTKTAAA